jgi:hypothetical protein
MKMVVLYYTKTDTYMVVDHNLDDTEAERECKQMLADDFPALTITQRGKHRAKDAEDCRACSKLVAVKRKEKKA